MASGAQRDHLIALCLNPSLEMIIAIFGVLKAGCGYLPIDPAYPEDRMNFILEDSLVSLLITTEARAEAFRSRLPLVLALDAEREKIECQSSANPGQHRFAGLHRVLHLHVRIHGQAERRAGQPSQCCPADEEQQALF